MDFLVKTIYENNRYFQYEGILLGHEKPWTASHSAIVCLNDIIPKLQEHNCSPALKKEFMALIDSLKSDISTEQAQEKILVTQANITKKITSEGLKDAAELVSTITTTLGTVLGFFA